MSRTGSWPAGQPPAADAHAGSGVDLGSYEKTLSFLQCFDTMFIVDDSASMEPYWADVRALLKKIAPICARYDPDGIDLYFVNHKPGLLFPGMSVRKSGYRRIGSFGDMMFTEKGSDVDSIFDKVRPSGKCNMGGRLSRLLGWYCDKLKAGEENAALNLIVLTTGNFDDDVKAPLVSVAKTLDELKAPAHQVGVQLFHMGKPNAQVQRAFQYLDDELYKETGTRDIIDSTEWNGEPGSMSPDDLVKIVLGAVVKKLDERTMALRLDGTVPARRADREV